MKIKYLEAIPLVRQLEDVFHGGTYKITSRNTIVTRVELDSGTVGEVFGGDEDQYQLDVCRIVNDVYRPLLIGGDVRDVEAHWERMWTQRLDLGTRGIHALDLAKHCIKSQAMAAVDLALWDALGKALDQPVYKLLGGYRAAVPVIAIGGYILSGLKAVTLETEIAHYQEQGIQGMKMKVGKLSVEEDIERTHRARKAGGKDFWLCTDANQSWTVAEAVKYARGVKELGLIWIEEPVRWHDQIVGNAQVREVGIPINAGQGEISRYGCRDLIMGRAVDILNTDVTIAGGVTEWKKIAGLASSFNVQIAHHEEPQVALHLLASTPQGIAVEIFPNYARDPMWFDLPQESPTIKNGVMLVNEKPGFGMPLKSECIERWRAK